MSTYEKETKGIVIATKTFFYLFAAFAEKNPFQ